MKKVTLIILSLLILPGCMQLGRVVNDQGDEGTIYSEAAFAQHAISAAEQERHKAINACVKSCEVKLSDLSEGGEMLAIFAQALGHKIDFCGCGALASAGDQQTNYFDAAIQKTRARWDGVTNVSNELLKTGSVYGVVDGVVDITRAAAKNAGDRYNTNFGPGSITQSTSNSGTGGAAAPAGSLADQAAGSATGGAFTQSESGIESNAIIVGGTQSVAGETAAAAQHGDAMNNGDSSFQVKARGNEFKQSPFGEEQQSLDNSSDIEGNGDGDAGLKDNDGGNGVKLEL